MPVPFVTLRLAVCVVAVCVVAVRVVAVCVAAVCVAAVCVVAVRVAAVCVVAVCVVAVRVAMAVNAENILGIRPELVVYRRLCPDRVAFGIYAAAMHSVKQREDEEKG